MDAALTCELGSMDGGGGSRADLFSTQSGDVQASRRLHGGKRWFLTREIVPGEPGFGVARRELFAVREDGALHVRLTGQPTMQYLRVDWAPDEDESGATISMFGRQWTGTSAADTVVAGTCGLYVAHLSFDADGNAVGLDADPVFRFDLGTYGPPGQELPNARTYSWSPDMTKLAVDMRNPGDIRVIDAVTGAVASFGPGEAPDWSPDGTRIAYARFVPGSSSSRDAWTIQTANPEGGSVATLASFRTRVSASTSQSVTGPKWSPDGAHVAYQYVFTQNGARWMHSVYRVAASGGTSTNLTPEVGTGTGGGTFGLGLRDWR
jgi:hypothetical protein